MYKTLPPFACTSGPHQANIVIVGEAWGAGEASLRRPFVGESGKELWLLLGEAFPDLVNESWHRATAKHRYGHAWVSEREDWLRQSSILLTNVLAFQPAGNQLESICLSKKELPPGYNYPSFARSKFLDPTYLPELERLRIELATARPNLVICLGNSACWALLLATNIGSIRGTVTTGSPDGVGPGIKCLPTYHPAAILRQWSWRPIVVADLLKAGREAAFPEIRRPKRQVLINPTIDEALQWVKQTIANKPPIMGVDCETAFGQIECISFARSSQEALVLPFIDRARAGWSYWTNPNEEHAAWDLVKILLESSIPKVFQNGLYDLQYILRMGFKPKALLEDTMLLHHALYPEVKKSLGFLGSIYTSEASWKLMRRRKADTEKRDE